MIYVIIYLIGCIIMFGIVLYKERTKRKALDGFELKLPVQVKPTKVGDNKVVNIFYPKDLDLDQANDEIVNFFKGKVKGAKTYKSPCGTTITQMPFTVSVPDGYELPKFNPETGKGYYPSDGAYTPHIRLRKIGEEVPND